MQAVQAAVKSHDWHVALGNPLLSDALGDNSDHADTYEGMIRYNVTTRQFFVC
jgi:hypothetical protein